MSPEQHVLLQQMNRVTELGDLLDLLVEALDATEAFSGYLINLLDVSGTALTCRASRLPAQQQSMREIYRHFRFPLSSNDDPTIRCFTEQKHLLFDDRNIESARGVVPTAYQRWGAAAVALLPIAVGGECIGTLLVYRTTPIDNDGLARVEHALGLFATRLRHALIHDQLRAKEAAATAALEEKQAFLEFISKINNLSSTDSIYQEIAERFLARYGFNIASFALAEDDSLVLQRFAADQARWQPLAQRLFELFGGDKVPLDHAEGASVFAFLQDMRVHVPDVEALGDMPMAPRDKQALDLMEGVRTVLHVPIRYDERPIGMMGLYSLQQVVSLDEAELKLIELFGSFLGTAIVNAQLYQVVADQKQEIEGLNVELQGQIDRLNDMVSRDQLTGLNNFGAFQAELERRVSEVERLPPEYGLALAIFDVDHFKRFNDTYGHVAGNYVLQEVARRIAHYTRGMDIPCRYGGEEFVVILPKCDLDGAYTVVERVREAIAAESFFAESQVVSVTASAGCASYRRGEGSESLLARADAALYRAKELGRNRVERAELVEVAD